MEEEDVLKDLTKIFKQNTDKNGLTDVHGVYNSLKVYMFQLKIEIERKNNPIEY